MNETMSLLLATTILALGGLGLYMVKSSDDNQKGGDEEYNEDKSTFGSGSLFNWIGQTENKEEEQEQEVQDDEEDDEEDYKPRKKAAKTQRNRKVSGSSKRRYY
jgi:hypothetical protein